MTLANPIEFLKQNPAVVLAVVLMPLVVALAIFAIMKLSEIRAERAKRRGWEAFKGSEEADSVKAVRTAPEKEAVAENAFPKPKGEKDLTIDDLRSREERLRAREEKLKRRKMLELEEKGVSVERKHVTGIVKEERKVTDAMEEKKMREQQADELGNNRKRLVKLIELAEDRYKDGLMSEKNFRSIMNGYQKELVEADVEMAKLKGYDI